MKIDELLKVMVDNKASDLHIKADSPPIFRRDEALYHLDVPPLEPEDTLALALEIMTDKQKATLEANNEVDLAYAPKGIGRFRVNVHYQRGTVALAIRRVNTEILGFEELHLPKVFEKISMFTSGFILVTGTTSSGKSTTQAAMIDYINEHRNCHVVTIEDPIEFLHEDKQAIITQREVGIDTDSFVTAIKHVVRQDPDVILIGEMRDAETFEAAVSASETGHLVISTLHTSDVMKSVDRLLDFFPPERHEQVRAVLALNLRAITCQRLVPRADGQGLIPAVEVLIATPGVVKLIRENRMNKIGSAIATGREVGMQTFNQSLTDLYRANLITMEDALAASTNPEALKMNLQGIYLDEDRSILSDM